MDDATRARIQKRVANRLAYLDAQVEEEAGTNKDLKKIQKGLKGMDSELSKHGIENKAPLLVSRLEKESNDGKLCRHCTQDLI
jgi:hypothetical protein